MTPERKKVLNAAAATMTPESFAGMLTGDELRALARMTPHRGQQLGSWLSEAWNNVTGTDLGEVAPYIAAGVGAAFGGAEVGQFAGQLVGQFSNLQSGGPQSAADLLRSLGVVPVQPAPPPPPQQTMMAGGQSTLMMVGLGALALLMLTGRRR